MLDSQNNQQQLQSNDKGDKSEHGAHSSSTVEGALTLKSIGEVFKNMTLVSCNVNVATKEEEIVPSATQTTSISRSDQKDVSKAPA